MKNVIIFVLLTLSILFANSALAGMTRCKLHYSLEGWSFIYSEYRGTGSVTCQNGQRARVSIVTRGGGLTLGKSDIVKGKGEFSDVKNISEVFGTYVAVNGHAGATKSVEGQAMTKGEVSLALSGKGRGFDLGVGLSAFTIEPQ